MRTAFSICIAGLLIVAPGQRPDEPDFSGEWVLINSTPKTTDAASALSVRQPIVRTTARGTPMQPFFSHLIVERHFASGVRSETFMIGVEGGTVGGMPSSVRVDTRQSVRWVGRTLVIETSRWSGPPGDMRRDTQRNEVWQFDADGRLIVALTEQEGAAESRTTTLTYRRR